MFTALDADPKNMDKHERKFVGIIREHGWHRMNVFADQSGPGFVYTTGFWLIGFPEIIVFSMKPEIAGDVLWDMFRSIKAGQTYPTAEMTNDIFANLRAYLLPVGKRHYPEHLGWSSWFYGNNEFPCLQLVWSDHDGVFPWERHFSAEFTGDQPDLSEGNWAGLAGAH